MCVCALTAKLECNSLSPSFPHVRSLLTYDDIIHLALNSGFANGRSINTIGEYNNKEEKHVPSGVVRLLNNIDEITKFTEDNFICFMSHQYVASQTQTHEATTISTTRRELYFIARIRQTLDRKLTRVLLSCFPADGSGGASQILPTCTTTV